MTKGGKGKGAARRNISPWATWRNVPQQSTSSTYGDNMYDKGAYDDGCYAPGWESSYYDASYMNQYPQAHDEVGYDYYSPPAPGYGNVSPSPYEEYGPVVTPIPPPPPPPPPSSFSSSKQPHAAPSVSEPSRPSKFMIQPHEADIKRHVSPWATWLPKDDDQTVKCLA
eukprot:TRINITY_DN10506_c0_g2_i9.p1 TRINITY_DN10506_c0_g2~~TRINITY_DN10506_c0_g2_i9.p1  ORF type:complete len:182 (+),score=20.90 TRINITY_DN10506_c0_g2_i9:43-546(+)